MPWTWQSLSGLENATKLKGGFSILYSIINGQWGGAKDGEARLAQGAKIKHR